MNKILNLTARPFRFLKPERSLLLLMLLVFCTTAFATPTTPTSDFIDNGDGTVTHKLTGLVWMRCSMGQTWDKATANCTGTAATYTWDAAMALKSDFTGKSDWRLPNAWELNTIVERENFNPAINTTLFPFLPNNTFWSSSPDASYSNYAWIVIFDYGNTKTNLKSNSYAVRLIREGQPFASSPLTTPTTDFTDNNDGTVTHKRTGLMWQRCSAGQTWVGTNCLGGATISIWNGVMSLKSTFADHSDWRVPNQNELLTITEYGTYNPSINTTIFLDRPISWIWSSSLLASSSYSAWLVTPYSGYTYDAYTDRGGSVRFVRGQWANVVANSVNLPDATIAGDAKGWVSLLSFGNTLGSYMGLTAYMNNADGSGIYQSNDLAFRFAKNVLHLARATQPIAKKFASANNGKLGYVVVNGNRTDIIAKYYPASSTTPPVNGSIISQTSTVTAGHVSIAKKVVKIDDNTLDVYLFEQNWIAAKKDKLGHVIGYLIADSRKMRFTKDATGAWTGKTTLSNKAVGWLNPEIK